MRIPRSAACALGVVAAAALFAGCSSGGSQPAGFAPGTGVGGVNPMVRHQVSNSLSIRGYATSQHKGKSWISPDAKDAARLLFISDDGTNMVNIYTMPAMALKGQISGPPFSEPQGMCADASGNIWIANTTDSDVVQYSRTGTMLKSLSIPGFYPVGCAVNKKTGDLAVSDIITTSGGAGNVEIFANGTGTPTTYTYSGLNRYYFIGYDPSGNLYVDGSDVSGVFVLAELASGGSSLSGISISGGTVHFPGMVQWYNPGNYLAVGDQNCGGTSATCVDWVSISGSAGTITATTNLSTYAGTTVCDMVQGVIGANGQKYLAGGDYEYCGTANTSVNRWPYEAGGSPTTYNDTTLTEPIGAAISTK